MQLNPTTIWLLIAVAMCCIVILLVIFNVRRQRRQREMFLASVLHSPHQRYAADTDEGIGQMRVRAMHDTTTPLADLGFEEVLVAANVTAPALPRQTFEEPQIVAIHVMATDDKVFQGYELLQALLAAGLRHGAMQIFHYYGEGEQILFSLASATEPGVFDLQRMGGFSCKGLTLFMNLAAVSDPQTALDCMVETAQQLADDLGGQLEDEQHQAWTEAARQTYQRRLTTV